MQNILVLAIVALVLSAAVLYIRKEKKRGVTCIGCPDASVCSGKCQGCSGNCHSKS